MTPALEAFLNFIAELGVNRGAWDYKSLPQPSLTLAVQHEAVGPLSVHDDFDELTVEIGSKHRAHFAGYNYVGDDKVARGISAAEDAAHFVIEMLNDRVCITVDYLDDRCVGSAHFYLDVAESTGHTVRDSLDGLRGGNIRSERFIWSGPTQGDG